MKEAKLIAHSPTDPAVPLSTKDNKLFGITNRTVDYNGPEEDVFLSIACPYRKY